MPNLVSSRVSPEALIARGVGGGVCEMKPIHGVEKMVNY